MRNGAHSGPGWSGRGRRLVPLERRLFEVGRTERCANQTLVVSEPLAHPHERTRRPRRRADHGVAAVRRNPATRPDAGLRASCGSD
jgi:hypothetical protein